MPSREESESAQPRSTGAQDTDISAMDTIDDIIAKVACADATRWRHGPVAGHHLP